MKRCQMLSSPQDHEATFPRWALMAMMTLHAGLLGWTAASNSPVLDEPAHLAAGLSHWQWGTFDLYRVNPPLVRMWAALPVLALGFKEDWRHFDSEHRSEFVVGRDFMQANRERSVQLFLAARFFCMPISLLGMGIACRWASELAGAKAGLVAAGLWCCSPNLIAHNALITPDGHASVIGLAACFLFWRWCRAGGWTSAMLAGAVLGAALLAKTTLILLLALWPLIWLVRRYCPVPCDARGSFLQLTALLVAALVTWNMAYGGNGALRPIGEFAFTSRALTREVNGQRENRFRDTSLGQFPVPVPAAWLMGIDEQREDFESRPYSYFRGEHRRGGRWHYYAYAALVKVPLGTWLLAVLSLAALVAGSAQTSRTDVALFLLAPMTVLFLAVSLQTGLNRHFRYVLPALPLGLVAVAVLVTSHTCGQRRRWGLIGGALAFNAVSLAFVLPHPLAYFNEAAGGTAHGHRHLLGSNLDWGQGLLALRDWMRQNPDRRPVFVDYQGAYDPRLIVPECQIVPERSKRSQGALPTGWYAVSINSLQEPHHQDSPLQSLRYTERLGGSLCVAAHSERTHSSSALVQVAPNDRDSCSVPQEPLRN